MDFRRSVASAAGVAVVLAVAFAPVRASQKDDKDKPQDPKKPRLTLKAQPMISMSPSRVVLTAELQGGSEDLQDYYCPSISWDWGDGTTSESSNDCQPYEAGKSEIKRRFTVEHLFRAGVYRVMLRLKQHDRIVAAATTTIQVRPGLRDIGE